MPVALIPVLLNSPHELLKFGRSSCGCSAVSQLQPAGHKSPNFRFCVLTLESGPAWPRPLPDRSRCTGLCSLF